MVMNIDPNLLMGIAIGSVLITVIALLCLTANVANGNGWREGYNRDNSEAEEEWERYCEGFVSGWNACQAARDNSDLKLQFDAYNSHKIEPVPEKDT